MKKILIIVAMFGIMSSAFADTLWILKPKPASATKEAHFVEYKNMKRRLIIAYEQLKDGEYLIDEGILIYKVNGKVYRTSLFELEYGD